MNNTATDLDKINSMIKTFGVKKGHVAEKVGISRVYLSYILNGHRPLSVKSKNKLFNYLGLTK